MSPEIAYFLKVNVAFMLFYAFYRLFFYKDTFFKLRRSILMIFLLLALVYPLMNFQEWVKEQEPIAEVILLYSTILPEISVNPEPAQTMDWQGLSETLLSGIYWLIVALFLVRFFIQFGSILWLALKSKKTILLDTKVHILDRPSGPFSFFKLIFLHPVSHSQKELEEILMHERTHASQWHSIDVILSELICILCWMNPFVWLLKREVRHNLEYLADNTVLQSGYDSKSYQYHLLGLAHHKNQAAANLYNSFNVLHLKNRISMMNKKRSRAIGRTKYLIFIPLVAMLMILSNIEAVARITKDLATDINTNEYDEVIVIGNAIDANNEPVIKEQIPVSDNNMENQAVIFQSENTENKSERIVFTVVEHMPRFPGGESELLKYISKNVKYPVNAFEKGIHGRVICSFVVDEDGSISEPEVLRGVEPELDREALRVINDMPVWTPGKQRGKEVAVKYTVPITFRLNNENSIPTTKASQMEKGSNPDSPVFTQVEVMPQYPGGEAEMLKFINQSIKYPVEAQKKGIQGRVICSYIVEKDGSLSTFEIVRSVDSEMDNEAVRVLKLMPKWTPGKMKGKPVRVKYTVPITFRIQ